MVVWGELFAAALLDTASAGEWAATLGAGTQSRVLACSAVHTSRAALAEAGSGACLVGVVLLAHAVPMTTRVGRALALRVEVASPPPPLAACRR